MIFFPLFFFSARPFDQKLGPSLIYFFYWHTTFRRKCMIVFHLSFLYARPFDQKLGSSLIYFFICTQPFDQSWGQSYSLIYSFLNCTNISFAILIAVCPYISYALFLAVLPLYFVRYIHSSITLIFRTLYSWKCGSYISYAIFMAI